MKYLIFSLLISAFPILSGAQGSITGFTISPANPVNTDTIYIYADLSFSSGECPLDNQSYSVNGTNIQASAHHCLGLLTVICTTVDTFKIDPLPDGTYDFNLSLTSGSGSTPCTPGTVADHDSTFTFTVGTSGLNNEHSASLQVYPNPVQDQLQLPSVNDGTAFELTTTTGQVVRSGFVNDQRISDLNDLPLGIYFLRLKMPQRIVVKQIAKD